MFFFVYNRTDKKEVIKIKSPRVCDGIRQVLDRVGHVPHADV
jgi:hypothetical protein